MKIIYVGDFLKKNGPSQVDINLCANFKEVDLIKIQIRKFINLKKLIKNIECDCIIVSGVSLIGVVISLIACLKKQKLFYIMHGSLKIEKKFREIKYKRLILEYLQLKLSSKIVCVSKIFSDLIKKQYPKLSNKIFYINNGSPKINLYFNQQNKKNNIVTFGGGRKEKGVLEVCKALELLKKETKIIDKIIVLGEEGTQKNEICKFNFVEWKGFVGHEEGQRLLKESKYFIQNSFHESFGLAPLEALAQGCKIVLSEKIPITEIINLKKDYICSSENPLDIKNKLRNIEFQDIKEMNINLKEWSDVAKEYLILIRNDEK